MFQKVNLFTVKEMQEESMLCLNGNGGSYLPQRSRYCLDHITKHLLHHQLQHIDETKEQKIRHDERKEKIIIITITGQ